MSSMRLELDSWPIIADGRTSSLVSGQFAYTDEDPQSVVVEVAGNPTTVLGPHLRMDDGVATAFSFIAEVLLPPIPAGTDLEICVEATFASGAARRMLSTVERSATPDATPLEVAGRVAIVMATFNPAPDVIARQIQSIKAQTFEDWICIVQDDGSSRECLSSIETAVDGDLRFHVAVNESNMGFYENFEAALSRVPQTAEFVALSDQDDFWHANKLEVLVDYLASHETDLVYSDLRIVDTDGVETSPSFSAGRASRRDDPNALLIANVVTGCSAMFRSSMLDLALPFPRAGSAAYHDHWLAYCAAASGGVGYIEEPLVDYYQHANNVLGARGSDRWRLARLALLSIAVPALVFAGALRMTRRRFRREFWLILNQAAEEYAGRLAFARTLAQRVPGLSTRLSVPTPQRERWLLGRLFAGAGFGIGHWTVSLRLLVEVTVERGMRTVAVRTFQVSKRLGLRG